jgi:2-polyprenyl-3-methyl-5-hydroxy-6-metoxy-1,4-benzoquinol methylase
MDLHLRRKEAADFSLGTSADFIYELIERTILEQNMTGSVLDYGAGVGHLVKRLLQLDRFSSVSGADIMGLPQELRTRLTGSNKT